MKTLPLEEALKFYPSFTQEDIALLTNNSIAATRKAIRAAGHALCEELTEPWKREIMLENLNVEQIAKKHITTVNNVRLALYYPLAKNEVRVVSHQEIINYMVANRGKITQIEIAKKFGVSQALVAKLNPFKQPYGPAKRRTPGEWLPILDYAKKHSIQAASLLYKVSRASIYRRLENEQGTNNKTAD